MFTCVIASTGGRDAMNFTYYIPTAHSLWPRSIKRAAHPETARQKSDDRDDGREIHPEIRVSRPCIRRTCQSGSIRCSFRSYSSPIRSNSTLWKARSWHAREQCDFIVGLGGGSSIDSAKSIALMATNEGDYWDYIAGGTGRRTFRKTVRFPSSPSPPQPKPVRSRSLDSHHQRGNERKNRFRL